MKFGFLRIFLLWFVFISFAFIVVFWGAEGGFKTILFAALILGLPAAIAATFIHKWVLEAKLKTLRNTSTSAQTSTFIGSSGESRFKIPPKVTKFLWVCVLIVLGLAVLPLTFLLGVYYSTKKITEVFAKQSLVSFPWYVGGSFFSVILYFIFHYIVVYRMLIFSMPILRGVSDSVLFLSLGPSIAFFVPVLFYECYHAQRKETLLLSLDGTIKKSFKISTIWFVLIPNLIFFFIDGYSNLVASSEAAGWGFLFFLMTIPFSLTLPSVWILWREKKLKELETENQTALPLDVEKDALQSGSYEHSSINTDIPDTSLRKKIHFSPLAILIILVVALVAGYNLFFYISLQMAIRDDAQAEKWLEQESQQESQRAALEDSIPASPNPVFDTVVETAKNELAQYLKVSKTDIVTLSYNTKTVGLRTWGGRAFCVEERYMRFIPFRDLSAEQKITIGNNGRIVDDGTVILSSPEPRVSVPIDFHEPLATHLSFDYRIDGQGYIEILFDDVKFDNVEASLENSGKNLYAKDILFTRFQMTPGVHRLTFRLKGAESAGISRLYLGNRIDGPSPCIQEGSENRKVVFQVGKSQYTYIINVSGKYFRSDGFR